MTREPEYLSAKCPFCGQYARTIEVKAGIANVKVGETHHPTELECPVGHVWKLTINPEGQVVFP